MSSSALRAEASFTTPGVVRFLLSVQLSSSNAVVLKASTCHLAVIVIAQSVSEVLRKCLHRQDIWNASHGVTC